EPGPLVGDLVPDDDEQPAGVRGGGDGGRRFRIAYLDLVRDHDEGEGKAAGHTASGAPLGGECLDDRVARGVPEPDHETYRPFTPAARPVRHARASHPRPAAPTRRTGTAPASALPTPPPAGPPRSSPPPPRRRPGTASCRRGGRRG